MRTVTVNIDTISAAIKTTNAAFDAEFETINSDDTQCRIWANRYERMIRKLQAGSAALRMAEDDDPDGGEEWDGMGDLNGSLITALGFDTTAKDYARKIEYLERRDRELRGVMLSADDEY